MKDKELYEKAVVNNALQKALLTIIDNYNKLINNPEANYPYWQEFGTFKRCLFCKVLNVERVFDPEYCKPCPLYDEKNADNTPSCANHETWELLYNAVDRSVIVGIAIPENYENTTRVQRLNMLKEAAKKRLLYIHLTASNNGFNIGSNEDN